MDQNKFGILCLAPGFGGLEINTLRLAGWMQELDWEVPLLLREGSAIHAKAQEKGFTVATLPAQASFMQQAGLIDRWVKEHQLKVLLIPFNKDIKTAALYKRFFNRRMRLVYQQHMQVGVKKRDIIHSLRYSMLDAWISPLQYLKEETMQKTRVPASRIHVIPFGLDLQDFTQNRWTKTQARIGFGLPPDIKLIGVLGRIDRKKGQDLVIKGIHRLKEQYGKDYHLLLLGDATLNEGDAFSMELKKIVTENGLEGKVHFRAYQPDIMQFFTAIDIFAMPSHGETFGMVTLEAMAAGIPVVGTGRDGTKEILQDGQYGYLFPLNDTDAFCRQIITIETDPELPGKLQRAKEEIERIYTYDPMRKQIARLIQSLILQ